jgi:DHA1 family multidrug resistance protein-like MFS transporter
MKKQIFISLFIATAITMLSMGIITPILPLYAKSMMATNIQLGIIFSGFALSRGIFAPIIGNYSDHHGRKNLIVVGLIFFIVLSICFALASSPLTLTIIRVVQGFSSILVTPVTQAYIGDITPKGKEGNYMNLFFMSFFAGQAAGPYFGGYLTDHFNIRMPFYVMALLSFLALILILFLVPESSAVKKDNKKVEPIFKSLLPVFKDKPMIGIMTYMSSRGFYRWGFNTFFPILAVKTISMSATNIGLILTAYMISGSIIQYPFGLAVDRFPKQKLNLILIGGSVSAIAMSIFTYFNSLLMYALLTIIMGVFSSISRASAVAIRTERGRIHGMGAATGAFTSSLSFGQVLGPIVFGIIADILNLPAAFIIGGVIGLIGTVVSYVFFKVDTDY